MKCCHCDSKDDSVSAVYIGWSLRGGCMLLFCSHLGTERVNIIKVGLANSVSCDCKFHIRRVQNDCVMPYHACSIAIWVINMHIYARKVNMFRYQDQFYIQLPYQVVSLLIIPCTSYICIYQDQFIRVHIDIHLYMLISLF